jgi:hypothetical protein
MLSVIKGLGPRDQFEAMLGAEIAAVHMVTMAAGRRVKVSENVNEHESMERSFTKLARTYVTQMEGLKRYRASGPQMVQNVSVSEGGQAIVASVSQPLAGATEVDAPAPSTSEAPKTVTNVVPFDTRECISVPPQRGKTAK